MHTVITGAESELEGVDWRKWLVNNNMYDAGMCDAAALARYCKYCGVEFTEAPRDTWPLLFRELLEFDAMLFGKTDKKLGLVS